MNEQKDREVRVSRRTIKFGIKLIKSYQNDVRKEIRRKKKELEMLRKKNCCYECTFYKYKMECPINIGGLFV